MNYKQEINTLLAETVAMQAVLVKVLSQLRAADSHLASLIAAGLNDAANQVEDIAIKFGGFFPRTYCQGDQDRRGTPQCNCW